MTGNQRYAHVSFGPSLVEGELSDFGKPPARKWRTQAPHFTAVGQDIIRVLNYRVPPTFESLFTPRDKSTCAFVNALTARTAQFAGLRRRWPGTNGVSGASIFVRSPSWHKHLDGILHCRLKKKPS